MQLAWLVYSKLTEVTHCETIVHRAVYAAINKSIVSGIHCSVLSSHCPSSHSWYSERMNLTQIGSFNHRHEPGTFKQHWNGQPTECYLISSKNVLLPGRLN